MVIIETGSATERPRYVRSMIRGGGGRCLSSAPQRFVVTWRRTQMVLLSTQGMDVSAIAKVAFTDPAGPASQGAVT